MAVDDRVSADRKLDAQRLVALFVVGWLLLNFPLLGLFDVALSGLGVPLLLLALLVIWALLIAATAALVDRGSAAQGDN